LAIVPYVPFFSLPYIADDYLQIELGRKYGPVSNWPELAGDVLYRCRATSILITHWTERLFGVSPAVFQAESTALHVFNTLLIAALGSWPTLGWRLSVVAAGFFAVHEGHQEAVVWYAALPELLVFSFVLLTLHAWRRWLSSERHAGLVYLVTFVSYLLALLSKESAVVAVPLMAVVGYYSGRPIYAVLRALLPFAAISVIYAGLIFAAKETHLHLNDGTFSPAAPVAEVLARSSFRLLWIWGVIAICYLAWQRPAAQRLLYGAATWIAITLLPYSFLTYMPQVPSRHVYLASVGLAFVVAGAMLNLWQRGPRFRAVAAAVAALIVVHNCAYLWIRKYPQYERRAAPTEKLLVFSERVSGPIVVKCFPYGPEIAILALQIGAARPAASTVFDSRAASNDGVYCDSEQP
jgi:hypothetical protein